MEVARGWGGTDREWFEAVSDDVDHTLFFLETTLDEQCWRASGFSLVALPATLGDDDVDEAGFIFEVQEGRATSGRWTLAMGDYSPDGGPSHPLDDRPTRLR